MFKSCQNNVLTTFFKKIFIMKIFIKIWLCFLLMTELGYTNEVTVFDFTANELSELQVRKVRGAQKKNNLYCWI